MSCDANLTFVRFLIQEDADAIADRLASAPAQLAGLLEFVRRHHLAGYVYRRLAGIETDRTALESLKSGLKPDYMRQWAVAEKLIRKLSVLADLFARRQQELLFLKGPLFAQRYYGDMEARATGDIDILVPAAAVAGIDAWLRAQGFVRKSRILFSHALTMRFTHHYEYVWERHVVELHWVLSSHGAFDLDEDRIWGDRSGVELQGTFYALLSDEYELVFQVLTILKDIELGRVRFKSFVDVYHLLQSGGDNDWQAFMQYRRREGLMTITLNVLDLVVTLLDCRDEFDGLREILSQHRHRIILQRFDQKRNLLYRRGASLANKLWAFRLYETGLGYAAGWWAVSLPFRLAAYRSRFSVDELK